MNFLIYTCINKQLTQLVYIFLAVNWCDIFSNTSNYSCTFNWCLGSQCRQRCLRWHCKCYYSFTNFFSNKFRRKKYFCLWKKSVKTDDANTFLPQYLYWMVPMIMGWKGIYSAFAKRSLDFSDYIVWARNMKKSAIFFRIFERIYFFSKWAALKNLRRSDFKILFVVPEYILIIY